MTANEIGPLFTFKPNTAEQDKSIEAVYAAAKVLAETIVNNVPSKHAQQGILQLGGLVTLCRQGIEVEPAEAHKPLLVRM
jgi:hypothetical protein